MAGSYRARRQGRHLAPGKIPDPLRAHGAWVYLIVSILAGALTAPGSGYGPALLAGGGLLGAFVTGSSLAAGGRRAVVARLALGLPLTIGALLLASRLGADRLFPFMSLLAIPPGLLAAWYANAQGFLSPGALAWGVTALAVAAPTAATAGGASPRSALLVLAFLVPFFYWRTWMLAWALRRGWTRQRFQRQGLIESALAVAWAAVAVAVVRLVSP